jgi:preprotein translocase subunit SecG
MSAASPRSCPEAGKLRYNRGFPHALTEASPQPIRRAAGQSVTQTPMVLYYLFSTFYVVTCLILLLVILLQQGKGDMAAAFGGGSSQSAFGARAGATVLSKATAILAALFMIGAMVLSGLGQRGPGSLLRGAPGPAPAAPAPASTTTPPASTPPATTPPATTPPATPPPAQPPR